MLTIGALVGQAQDMKLAGVEYAYYPEVQLADDASGYEVAFQEFAAFVNFPKVMNNHRTILVNGVNYGFVQSTFSNEDLGTENSQFFHRMVYSFMAVHRWEGAWMLSVRLAPTLATDFKDPLSRDDFVLQGSLIASKKSSEFIRWGGGLIYTTRLGQPFLLPAMQFRYKEGRHSLNVFLPAFIDYVYALGTEERFQAGFRIGVNGANFNASMDQNAGLDVDRLNYVRVNLGPKMIYRITNMIQMEAFGGLSTKRMYRFESMQGSTYDYDSKSGAFLNVALVIVPPGKR